MNGQAILPFNHRSAITLHNQILEFSTNYRKRALGISLIQVVLCISFTLVWRITRDETLEKEKLWLESVFENGSFPHPFENVSRTTRDSIWRYFYTGLEDTWFDCDDLDVCFFVFKMWFHRDLTAVSFVLHMFSAVLLICATLRRLPRPFNIALGTLAKWMNVILIILQIAVLSVLNQMHELPFWFFWYGYYFNREASGLLTLIKTLAPPPPGHSV